MTIGKPIALARWIFVGKVMPLLFNMLSRLVITFFQGMKWVYKIHCFKCLLQERHNFFKQLYPCIRQKWLHYM